MAHLGKPVGICPYCQQEFMTKGGFAKHMDTCPDREAKKAPVTPPEERYRPTVVIGGATVWTRR